MKRIADDFDAIAKRLREIKQEGANAEKTSAAELTHAAANIFKWSKMVERAKMAGRPLMIISQPRNRFVAP